MTLVRSLGTRRFLITPAVERMLEAAASWASDRPETGAVEMLLGMLDEPESRGAAMLARHGIDRSAVLVRWPLAVALDHDASARPISPRVAAAWQAMQDCLAHHPQPLAVATEHVLLALVCGNDDVAEWLHGRGLTAAQLASEIDRIYGVSVDRSPIPMGEPDTMVTEAQSPRGPIAEGKAVSATASRRAGDASTDRAAVLRIIDASANRAREGLRVVEDFARFALDDRFLTLKLKELRHDLAGLLSAIPQSEMLACRDTQGDVGTAVTTSAESRRETPLDVAEASFKRLQESLRSLEEYGKTIDPSMAAGLKQLRYRAYTLERAVLTTAASLQRLAAARLYVLIDGRGSPEEFSQLARSLVAAGVHVLQLRDKTLDDRRLLDRAKLLRAITAGTGTLFILNDRPDLSLLAQADGVHLGQEELPVGEARRIVGLGRIVGVSTHSIEQARTAVLEGADYLGVGPTFPSGTKKFASFPGLALVRQVAAEIRLPAFAIGGITQENVAQVLGAGLNRVAVGGAVVEAADPARAAKELLARLDRSA
jgi:thiamine-phosphate pyrophosphorylase